MPNSDQQSNYSQLNVEQAYRRMGGRHPTRSNSSLEVHTSPVKNSREWFSQLPNPRSQSRGQEHLTQQTNQPTKKQQSNQQKKQHLQTTRTWHQMGQSEFYFVVQNLCNIFNPNSDTYKGRLDIGFSQSCVPLGRRLADKMMTKKVGRRRGGSRE